MSKSIIIMGESGSGKTTAMRNLNPETTFYIDCDKKGLNWKGWKEQYNKNKKNYVATSDPKAIVTLLNKINTEYTKFNVVVIDTINWIMVDEEFKRMKEKNYDKWMDLAFSIYDIASMANNLRDDLTIILVAHSQTERDESGYYFTRVKTSGRKLEKIVIESKVSTVLLAKCVDGKYIFETKNDNSTVKSPLGAFTTDKIDNDIVKVLEALKEY